MKRKRRKIGKRKPKLKGRKKQEEKTFGHETEYEMLEYPTETNLIFRGFLNLFKILRHIRDYDINEDLLRVSEFQFYENYIPTKVVNDFRQNPKFRNRIKGYTRNLSFNCRDQDGDLVYIKYVPSNKFPVGYGWKDHENKYNPIKVKREYNDLINSISMPDVSRIIFVLNNFGKGCSSNYARKTFVFKSSPSAKKFDKAVYDINEDRKGTGIKELRYEIISLSDTFAFYSLYKSVIDHNEKLWVETWKEKNLNEERSRILGDLKLEEANSRAKLLMLRKREKYIFFREDGIVEELENVVKKYGAIEKLPNVYLDDPYALMLGAKHGDVLKFTKLSQTAGSICTYKYVSDKTRKKR